MIKVKYKKELGVGLNILAIVVALALSWICTCGMFKLITLCFDWNYTWKIATGVWLSLTLLSSFVKFEKKSDSE